MSIDDIKEVAKHLADKPMPAGFTFIVNEFLPDNIIVVSKNVFEKLKDISKKGTDENTNTHS